jgi:hypothetical protein
MSRWEWLRDPLTRRRKVYVMAALRDSKGRVQRFARTEFVVIQRRRW